MRKVAFITHLDCDRHSQIGHPECAARTAAIASHFEKTGLLSQLVALTAAPATVEQVALNHDMAYIEYVKATIARGGAFLDPDTYVTEYSFAAALLSYGGALLAVDKVVSGELDRAFCCLRPPGHHAGYETSQGFCIFNNIAGAARYAQTNHGLTRISIVDFDAHHGNGTQWSFYEDNSVHYTSLHQYPFYPGTGAAGERGRGVGEGFNLNLPLPAGTTGKPAAEKLGREYVAAMTAFQPELILVSAGFDGHRHDPLTLLSFEDEDYLAFTQIIAAVADRHCRGRGYLTTGGRLQSGSAGTFRRAACD